MSHGPGQRLYLRLTTPDQIGDRFLEMFLNMGGKNDYFRQSGREFTKAELVGYCSEGLERGNVFYYSICTLNDDAVIGCIRIGPIDFKNSLSDMVALIGDVSDRGRGLGTEAIRLGAEIAFTRHNLRKLSGGILAPNTAAFKAYTRAGWIEEGRMKAHILHRGEPTDWIAISCFNPHWHRAGTDPKRFQVPGLPPVVQTDPSKPPAPGPL